MTKLNKRWVLALTILLPVTLVVAVLSVLAIVCRAIATTIEFILFGVHLRRIYHHVYHRFDCEETDYYFASEKNRR